MHAPFWLTTALLFPVLLYQGKRTRRVTPRLPEASGACSGQYGEGSPAFRLLVLGESTAAGVGVESHAQGLASQLALNLHQRTGLAISWHTIGVNGIRLGDLLRKLASTELPEADAVLLSMGVNDTTGFTPRFRFRRSLKALRATTATRYSAPITLLSVPPMEKFTALPAPLRQMMGWRARQLDKVYQALAASAPADFRYLTYPTVENPALLARDGYHPSEQGYSTIAQALAEQDWGLSPR
ncbi:SGNH/GDSL hydrolase family protein [Marinobacter daepoensis]|uniref:SGNH/GDSL hydrolase family protein n=1 Tax=Marinobacter daepoensis TaxID=262077 RepID=A0ABS3BLC4_9GAMM|nr:SGNH/GDSL hydrolase family protein [Marinobacter daepoensis]MBN7771651.1 SGNH/GDSL hydrolase family protein [Marinobacter daepoensis]MBY6080950.1 SGNH/GDSL hydrolase family protein [Marinobacter daepoensis]